jgi:hypothetical protein
MKTITITNKRNANSILLDSLFNPINGGTLNKARYDMGKYDPKVNFQGRKMQVEDHIYALWSENRRDKNGAYKAMFCLSSR